MYAVLAGWSNKHSMDMLFGYSQVNSLHRPQNLFTFKLICLFRLLVNNRIPRDVRGPDPGSGSLYIYIFKSLIIA